jgi:anti-sigma factor RsiW
MNPDPHIDEEDLEAYALGRLSAEASRTAENHLLCCEHCSSKLSELKRFVELFRAAMPKPNPESEQ